MPLSLKKQQTTLNPECISDVLASIRYTPPSSRRDKGFISVLDSPPVRLNQMVIWGHIPHSKVGTINLKVVGYTDLLILSRFFGTAITFQNWYPKSSRPSDRQRHWEMNVGLVTISCIRQWGDGKG